MDSPEQDPRFSTPGGPAVRVTAVMAGQEWVDPNGCRPLAATDCVILEFLDPVTGRPVAAMSQTPDAALGLAVMIQQAAIKLINAEVKDDGTKHSPLERMARIHNAYKETP